MSLPFGGYINSIAKKIKESEISICSSLVITSTGFLNYALNKSYFKCPATSHRLYGWCFLIIPGFLLALLSLLASERFTRTVTGLCREDIDVPETAKGGKRRRTWLNITRNLSIAMSFAMLAFMSWAIFTLLFTDTYVCINIGPFKEDFDLKKKKEYMLNKDMYETHSELLGLLLMSLGLMVTVVLHLVIKCTLTDYPEKELASMRSYDKFEAKSANEEFKILLEKSAEARGKEMVAKLLEKHCNKEISSELVLERDEISDLRMFLALRYPKIDMIGNSAVSYCVQAQTPSTFSVDHADAPPTSDGKIKQEDIPLDLIRDSNCNISNV